MKPSHNDIVIRIAAGDGITDFQKFLFRIYCHELRWHDPAHFSGGIFSDLYDEHAVFLTVHAGNRLISGLRLVRDSEKRFPHEQVANLRLPHLPSGVVPLKMRAFLLRAGRGKIMEITRFVGDTTVERTHMYDLVKAMYWYATYNGIEAYFMCIDLQTFLHCHKCKIPVIPIGVPLFCEGSWAVPAILLVHEMIAHNPDMYEYFMDTSNLSGTWQNP